MKSRRLAMYALIVAIAATTVAYAVLQTTLNISGTVTKKGGSWNIYFENVANVTKSGDATMSTPTIASNTTTNFTATLYKPNDAVSFTVDVKNAGTVDAILDSVALTGTADASSKDITYTATYSDGTAITKDDKLLSGTKKTIKVTVSYNNLSSLSATDQTLNLGLTLVYMQTDKETQGEGGLAANKPCEATSGNGTTVGDVITCGTESFNVISSDETTITMFASKNVDTTTLKQSDFANEIEFSTNDYWSEEYLKVEFIDDENYSINLNTYTPVDPTAIKTTDAIEVAKRYIANTISGNVTGRLITKEEIESIFGGCSLYELEEYTDIYGYDCPATLNFLLTTDYWTGSSFSNSNMLYLIRPGDKRLVTLAYGGLHGLRPVVTISKIDVL